MARLKCICGESLSNSTNPEIEFLVHSDREWDKLINRTEKGEKPLDFVSNAIHFWKCPNCSRIYFFEDGNDKPLQVYKLDIDN